jgi:hypothetical protein
MTRAAPIYKRSRLGAMPGLQNSLACQPLVANLLCTAFTSNYIHRTINRTIHRMIEILLDHAPGVRHVTYQRQRP